MHLTLLLLQALSPVGRCQTFEASADGYGRGEGFAALVLQSAVSSGLEAAGPQPLAVVAGSAVNQDGRSSSLTAPNGPAQTVRAGAQGVSRLAVTPSAQRCRGLCTNQAGLPGLRLPVALAPLLRLSTYPCSAVLRAAMLARQAS